MRGQLPTLVVSPQHYKLLWIVEFEGSEVRERLDREYSPVDVVSEE